VLQLYSWIDVYESFNIQRLYTYSGSTPIPPISGSHNQSTNPTDCTRYKINSSSTKDACICYGKQASLRHTLSQSHLPFRYKIHHFFVSAGSCGCLLVCQLGHFSHWTTGSPHPKRAWDPTACLTDAKMLPHPVTSIQNTIPLNGPCIL
jgi:hypothetical protein